MLTLTGRTGSKVMHFQPFRTVLILLALVLASELLVSCESKITQANFDRIETGMPRAEVIALLGEPTEASSINFAGLSGTSAKWIKGDTVITIQFFNEKVRLKKFSREPGAAAH